MGTSKISVFVKNGAVTLKGSVPSFLAQKTACDDAWTVSGVVSVDNKLKIEFPAEFIIPNDNDIKSKVENILEWNSEVDASNIRLRVNAGSVTLEGSSDSYWKKVYIEDIVRRQKPCTGNCVFTRSKCHS